MDLGRLAGNMWDGFTWLRIGLVVGCFKHGNELSGSGTTELVS
jgi:hypothetical protein